MASRRVGSSRYGFAHLVRTKVRTLSTHGAACENNPMNDRSNPHWTNAARVAETNPLNDCDLTAGQNRFNHGRYEAVTGTIRTRTHTREAGTS